MTRSLRKAAIVAVFLSLVVTTISPNIYSQSRLGRAPARDPESTAPIPAGSANIPAGTIIILEIDDKLSSGSSQVSDRFRAHVASPVTDTAGKTLIPIGIGIDGRVSSVSKAKWRHRSGLLAIVFDNLRRPNGDPVPVKGTLTSANAEDRKRLDEEAYLKGDSSLRRDILFVGGGAGTGAVIGMFTGGMLAGAGVGAAAGLTAALLMKGKDVTVEPGERFGMVLTQPIPSNLFQANATPIPTPTPTPTSQPQAQPSPLNPYDAVVMRESDGLVRIRLNAEAPSQNWRADSSYENLGNGVIRIGVKGIPPRSVLDSQFQSALIPVGEIGLEDRSRLLSRADFVDKYGRHSFSIDIPSQPGSRTGRASNAPYSGGSTGVPPVGGGRGPTLPPARVAALAKGAAGKVDVVRTQYAGLLQYFINADGSTTFLGTQRPAPEQQQFFDALMTLHTSLIRLQNNASDPNATRLNAQRVQDEASIANQASRRVRLDNSLNNSWNAAYAEINSMLNSLCLDCK
ncbi:MAG: hypothetical protein ACKVZH_15960 [Blastocatellia bacterium]